MSIKFTFNPRALTSSERESFINGWQSAGGFTGDLESDSPWAAPWSWAASITIDGRDFLETAAKEESALIAEGYSLEKVASYAAGAAYWRKVAPEVRALLEEERRAAEENSA